MKTPVLQPESVAQGALRWGKAVLRLGAELAGLPGGATGKEPTADAGRGRRGWVQSLGRGDPLEEGMAVRFSTLAWSIPWTESLVGCRPWGRTESNMTK